MVPKRATVTVSSSDPADREWSFSILVPITWEQVGTLMESMLLTARAFALPAGSSSRTAKKELTLAEQQAMAMDATTICQACARLVVAGASPTAIAVDHRVCHGSSKAPEALATALAGVVAERLK